MDSTSQSILLREMKSWFIKLTLAGTGDFGDLGEDTLPFACNDEASGKLALDDAIVVDELEKTPLSPVLLIMSFSMLQRSSSRASRSTSLSEIRKEYYILCQIFKEIGPFRKKNCFPRIPPFMYIYFFNEK